MSHLITAQTEAQVQVFDPDNKAGAEHLKELKHVSQLDYSTWLPFAAKTYHISPHIEDYALVVSIVCPADIPNRNGVAFPLQELKKFQPPPIARMVYKAWSGCPMHLEHDNLDCTKAYGAVLDTSLHKVTGYGGQKLWKVMGLFAIDKNKHPDTAQDVISGKINTYSMGAMADYFTCSFCGSKIEEYNHCSHVDPKKGVDFKEVLDYDGTRHLAFRNAHNLSTLEVSIVAEPAWTAALSDHFLPSITQASS